AAVTATSRAGTLADVARLPAAGEVVVALRPPAVPDDALFAEDQTWRFAVYDGATSVLTGECERPEELSQALGARPVVVHDAKGMRRVPDNLGHDTLIGAYLLDPAARAYLLEELAADRGLSSDLEDPAARDAVLTSALAVWQREALEERGHERLLADIELPLVRVLRELELAGLRLDTGRLGEIASRVRADADRLEREIFELAGEEFTIGSPQQLAEILFVKLGLSRKRRGKTGFSTDARVLAAIRDEHEIIPRIERFRELTKIAQTYLDALPAYIADDGRLHTTFSQVTAATGRLSSINPNLQNVPIRTELGREVRACFVAEPGNLLVTADYSQVELRVLAQVADEPVLKDIFRAGDDVHAATAMQVFGVAREDIDPAMRSKSKMINYGIVYGLSAFGMADRLQIAQEEAEKFIDAYLERFPKVRQFIEATIERATEEGYVTTLFGRRRRVPELRARRWEVRKLGERLAVNTVIQGTAADIIKVAMVRCHDALARADLRTRSILQIHDELLFEGPAEEAEQALELVCREMRDAWELDPPLVVDAGIGPNWMDAK
ncbi:MAG: DNA polymerase, partial [Actinomycetota bacterium]|nr:DNA polymerase [Actinomycetota bacterium]